MQRSRKPKVVAIGGSPRKDGNTEQLLKFALDIISGYGVETEYIGLRGKKIEGCTSCRHCRVSEIAECSIKDDFDPIFRKVYEADGLILGSPVYFGTQTAKMTALLERLGMVAEGRHGIDIPLSDVGWPESKGPGLYAGKVGGPSPQPEGPVRISFWPSCCCGSPFSALSSLRGRTGRWQSVERVFPA